MSSGRSGGDQYNTVRLANSPLNMEQSVVVIVLVVALSVVSHAQLDFLNQFANVGSLFGGKGGSGGGGGGSEAAVKAISSFIGSGAGGGAGGGEGGGGAEGEAAKIIGSFIGSGSKGGGEGGGVSVDPVPPGGAEASKTVGSSIGSGTGSGSEVGGGDAGGAGGGEALKAISGLIGSGTGGEGGGGDASGAGGAVEAISGLIGKGGGGGKAGGGGDVFNNLLHGIGLDSFKDLFGGGGGGGGGDPLSSLLGGGGGGNPFSSFLGSGNPDPLSGDNNDLIAELLGVVGKGKSGGSPLDVLGSFIGSSDNAGTVGQGSPLDNVDMDQLLAGGLLGGAKTT